MKFAMMCKRVLRCNHPRHVKDTKLFVSKSETGEFDRRCNVRTGGFITSCPSSHHFTIQQSLSQLHMRSACRLTNASALQRRHSKASTYLLATQQTPWAMLCACRIRHALYSVHGTLCLQHHACITGSGMH
eukprot:1157634-Pelagomonas_calceolata.AAC.2